MSEKLLNQEKSKEQINGLLPKLFHSIKSLIDTYIKGVKTPDGSNLNDQSELQDLSRDEQKNITGGPGGMNSHVQQQMNLNAAQEQMRKDLSNKLTNNSSL
jgi:hypothetical protein